MNTLKQQIIDVAAYCNITPRMATVLQRFFLEIVAKEEEKELNDWINERIEHDQLFDLLCQVNKDGTGAGTMHMLIKLANKPAIQRSRREKILKRIIQAVVVIFLWDTLSDSHPISALIFGPDGPNFVSKTVEAGDEMKTVWLYDSTRVDLHPHSKIGYAGSYFSHNRKVQLWGSATFYVQASADGPLKIKSGSDCWLEFKKGTFTVLSDSTHPVVKLHTP
jgi:ferric-dicitrate binding protein FerR (iron transport regulator)